MSPRGRSQSPPYRMSHQSRSKSPDIEILEERNSRIPYDRRRSKEQKEFLESLHKIASGEVTSTSSMNVPPPTLLPNRMPVYPTAESPLENNSTTALKPQTIDTQSLKVVPLSNNSSTVANASNDINLSSQSSRYSTPSPLYHSATATPESSRSSTPKLLSPSKNSTPEISDDLRTINLESCRHSTPEIERPKSSQELTTGFNLCEQQNEMIFVSEPSLVLNLPKPVSLFGSMSTVNKELIDLENLLFNSKTADAEVSQLISISKTVKVEHLMNDIEDRHIFSNLNNLDADIGNSFRNISFQVEKTKYFQSAEITFDSKFSALAFYRKTKGKFMSKELNVSFSKIQEEPHFNNFPQICSLSLNYTKSV